MNEILWRSGFTKRRGISQGTQEGYHVNLLNCISLCVIRIAEMRGERELLEVIAKEGEFELGNGQGVKEE